MTLKKYEEMNAEQQLVYQLGAVEASLQDKLTDRGWVECGTCKGSGCENGFMHEAAHCPDCAYGFVPPEPAIEAARNAMESVCYDDRAYVIWDGGGEEWREAAHRQARAALIAAARWERES